MFFYFPVPTTTTGETERTKINTTLETSNPLEDSDDFAGERNERN